MSTSSSNSNEQFPVSLVAPISGQPAESEQSAIFRQCLLDNLSDGVIFVDAQQRIFVWSQTVEVMTGMSARKTEGLKLTPSLLGLVSAHGNRISEQNDPVAEAFRTRKRIKLDARIVGRSGREVKVDLTVSPVLDDNGVLHGGMILVHDTSVQLDLQRQLKDLYEFSMLDPLTQVANRAEFERVLDEYVRLHHSSDFKCSLIVCDIDFFKQINDNYNHHIGDQALVSFAGLLKKFVRSQDLVARYGGEEFVILCADCDKTSGVQRAEEIRITLTKTPQQMLDGKCITASFGVSELQSGDSPTDFFVRADTALLRAKELGRNRVVEASLNGLSDEPELTAAEVTSLSGVSWRKLKGRPLLSDEFGTNTPITILIEKLRGYIVETDAEIRRVGPDFASLTCEVENPENYSQRGKFYVDVELQERMLDDEEMETFGQRKKTYIRITIREGKRKWFAQNANELAPVVMKDLRTYLMISDEASKLEIAPQATESNR
jgi:diguanylate cyclase (GGDEF)-like protein/PAS domain S-box-containing protein